MKVVILFALCCWKVAVAEAEVKSKWFINRILAPIDDACVTNTDDLEYFLDISLAFNELEEWSNSQTRDVICTNPSKDKTTCVAAYVEGPQTLQEPCLAVRAMFITTTYVFQCTEGNEVLFYTVDSKPECYHMSCSYDNAVVLAGERSDRAMQALADELNMECTRMRLEVADPILPEVDDSGPLNCTDGTTQLMSTMANVTLSLNNDVSATIRTMCLEQGDNSEINTTPIECSADIDSAAHNLAEDCAALNGIYLEFDTTLECQSLSSASPSATTIEISGEPLCVSRTHCTIRDYDDLAMAQAQILVPTIVDQDFALECTILDVDIEDFSASSSPSISPAPSTSQQPSASPSISAMPTFSFAPSWSPTDLGCLQSTILLNASIEMQSELIGIQAEIDVNAFGSYCQYPEDPMEIPFTVTCNIDYTDIEQNLTSVCEALGGMYVEEQFSLFCESESSATNITYINKPVCRDLRCNSAEVKEMLTYEMEWLRAGLQEASWEETCAFRDVQVYVGGRSSQEEGELSEECIAESSLLDSIIPIYNEKLIIRSDFIDYTSIDLREICISTTPGTLKCDFNWDDFSNGLEALCAPNGGQYVESAFSTSCFKDDSILYLNSRNVPSCLGVSCSPGQAEVYLPEEEHSWLAELYAEDGWQCETNIVEVFLPHYVPPTEPAPSLTESPSSAPSKKLTQSPSLAPSTKGLLEPSSQPVTTEQPTIQGEDNSLSIGVIIGIGVGAVIVFTGIACLSWFKFCRREEFLEDMYWSDDEKDMSYEDEYENGSAGFEQGYDCSESEDHSYEGDEAYSAQMTSPDSVRPDWMSDKNKSATNAAARRSEDREMEQAPAEKRLGQEANKEHVEHLDDSESDTEGTGDFDIESIEDDVSSSGEVV